MRTLQSKPAVMRKSPERGRVDVEAAPVVAVGVVVGLGVGSFDESMLISSLSADTAPLPPPLPLLVPFVCVFALGKGSESPDARKNLMSDTDDLCAGMMCWVRRARRSHIRTVSSPEPVATWYLGRVSIVADGIG